MKKLILLLMFSTTAMAQDINFNWDKPTERTNGATLFPSEIGSYTIYENYNGEVYEVLSVGGTYEEATYYFDGYGSPCYSISTTDSWGQEGSKSPEICINVFPAPPAAPALNVSF